MRILVISDTHIPVAAKELPSIIMEEAKKSDLCFHAGDLISINVFQALSKITKTYAVRGNMDSFNLSEQLPEKQIIEIGDITVGLMHGRGSPAALLDYVNKEFEQNLKKINILIFGHTHYPCDKEFGGRIYFNPGSPTDIVFAPYKSYGILEIEGKDIKRRVVKIE